MFRKVTRLGSSAAKINFELKVAKILISGKSLVGQSLSLVLERGGKQLVSDSKLVISDGDNGSYIELEEVFRMTVTLYKNAGGHFHDKKGRIIVRQANGRSMLGKEIFIELGVVQLAIHSMVCEDLEHDSFSQQFEFTLPKTPHHNGMQIDCHITTKYDGTINLEDDNLSVVSGASDLNSVQGNEWIHSSRAYANSSLKRPPSVQSISTAVGGGGTASVSEINSLKSQIKILQMNLERANVDRDNLALVVKDLQSGKSSNVEATLNSVSPLPSEATEDDAHNVSQEILKLENRSLKKSLQEKDAKLATLNSLVGAEAISMSAIKAQLEEKDATIVRLTSALATASIKEETANTEIIALNDVIKEKQGLVVKYQEDIADITAQYHQVINPLQNNRNDKEELETAKSNLDNATSNWNISQQKNMELLQLLEEKGIECDSLQFRIDALEAALVLEDKNVSTISSQRSFQLDRKTVIHDLETKIEALQEDNECLRIQVADSLLLINEHTNQHTATVNNLTEELNAVKYQQQQQLEHVNSLSASLSASRKQQCDIAVLHEHEMMELRNSFSEIIQELKGSLSSTKRALDAMTANMNATQQNNVELTQQLEGKVMECDSLLIRIAALEEALILEVRNVTAISNQNNFPVDLSMIPEGEYRRLFEQQLTFLTNQLENCRNNLSATTVHVDEERLKNLALKKCLMKFSRRFSSEDVQSLLEAGIILQ